MAVTRGVIVQGKKKGGKGTAWNIELGLGEEEDRDWEQGRDSMDWYRLMDPERRGREKTNARTPRSTIGSS